MANIEIRKLVSEDIEEIGKLICTRDELNPEGAARRKKIFEWIAFRNPFSHGETTYYIAKDNGRIIGHLGRMPMQFSIHGEFCKGYFPHDLYVHPEYRQKGMGALISISLFKALEKETESFGCNMWISAPNFLIQKRRGYHELSFDRYVRLLNPYENMIRFVKNRSLAQVCTLALKGIFAALEFFLTGIRSSRVQISKIERFDGRFDALNEKVYHGFCITPSKPSDYLNWKYVDRPFSHFTTFAAEENGQVRGFLVSLLTLKEEYPSGMIVDIFADPDDKAAVAALYKAVINHFRSHSVSRIECLLTNKKLVRILRKFLFLKGLEKVSVTLANLDKFAEKESLMDIINWHLTYGDSDGCMWI